MPEKIIKATPPENDPVKHPNHYCYGKFECVEVIQELTAGASGAESDANRRLHAAGGVPGQHRNHMDAGEIGQLRYGGNTRPGGYQHYRLLEP